MRSDLRGGLAALGLAGTIGAVGLAAARGRSQAHGLHHTGVTVRDFEAAVAWYHRHFGFLLVTEMLLDGEDSARLADLYGRPDLTVRLGFMRGRDGSILEVFEFDPPLPPAPVDWNRPGYTHVAMAVSDVPAWVRRLEGEGIEFLTPVQETAGAHWVFFRDPDGNLVELIDLHADRLLLRHAGGLVGRLQRWTTMRRYYTT
ncbi:MAG: VOC family protein [Mobilicoccus sp.]|nr:VOC family protein [Mobilicoccus sp.]